MKGVAGLCVAIVFMVTQVSFAQPAKDSKQEVILKSGAEIGFEVSHIKYEEPDFMEEEGIMYGLSGSYAVHQNKSMLKLDGRLTWGQVDYTSPESGDLNDINDYIFETRFSLGYDYSFSTTTIMTPYIGIGYRYLNDDTSGMVSSTGTMGYERESNYLYSPIGIDITSRIQNGWIIGATAEYDLFWYGLQRTHLEDIAVGLNALDNDQHEGWGVRGSVKIEKKSGNIDFVIEPFIRYWDIKKSDESVITYYNFIIGEGYEPANNSTEWGIKLALKF